MHFGPDGKQVCLGLDLNFYQEPRHAWRNLSRNDRILPRLAQAGVVAAVSRWQALAALISSVTVLPLLVIALSFADVNADIWAHLSEFVLPRLLANTALLLGVGVGCCCWACLWLLVAVHEFLAGGVHWALMLPWPCW